MTAFVTLTLAATLAWQQAVPGVVMKFPLDFKPEYGERIQHLALETWPGPDGLVTTWRSGGLKEQQQVAWLLGAAAFHDRKLLPVYQEAVQSQSARVRLAAAYGYRTLIGDPPPPTHITVSDEQALALLEEMRTMETTLRRHPLPALWLASALHAEGTLWPGWSGLLMQRPAARCLQAFERIAQPEDLELLLSAYPLFEKLESRISLLLLIEGMTLSRFVSKPASGKAWGPEIYAEGGQRLDDWLQGHCGHSFEEMLVERFAAFGVTGVDPLHADACVVWQEILVNGDPSWWWLTAKQLYHCGAPPATLSILRADSEENRQQRDRLLSWYGLLQAQAPPARRDNQPPPRRPNPFAGRE